MSPAAMGRLSRIGLLETLATAAACSAPFHAEQGPQLFQARRGRGARSESRRGRRGISSGVLVADHEDQASPLPSAGPRSAPPRGSRRTGRSRRCRGLARHRRAVSDEIRAAATARSATPSSYSRTASDVEVDVVHADGDAAACLQRRQHHGQAGAVPADHGAPRHAERRRGRPGAWISTSTGLVPSSPANTAAPDVAGAVVGGNSDRLRPRLGRHRSSRIRRSRRSRRIRFFTARAGCGTGGRVRPRSHSTVSTMCSSTRAGWRDGAVLGNMADDGRRRRRGQHGGSAPPPRRGPGPPMPGALSSASRNMVWIRSITTIRGRPGGSITRR